MDQLAQKYISDHKNPLVKVELTRSKLFLKSLTAADEEYVTQQQETLEKCLRHDRVERRCARSQAIWLPDKNLAEVTKVVKTLKKNFGYQDKNGIYLLPEEMLFLLETNRLEVCHNEVPLSIEETYRIIMNIPKYNLTKYRVYKKLVLQGYKLVNKEEIARRQVKLKTRPEKYGEENGPNNKRCCEDNSDEKPYHKKVKAELLDSNTCTQMKLNVSKLDDAKIEPSSSQFDAINYKKYKEEKKRSETIENISNLFQKLRETGPKPFKTEGIEKDPDYYVFLPTNNEKLKFDYKLYICKSIIEACCKEDEVPNIYAICTNDNICFYRCSEVCIPNL